MTHLDSVHPLHQIIIAIFLGLFVGLQRQWEDAPLGGIRTFSLISLMGALTANLTNSLGPWPLVVGAIGTIVFIVSSLRSSVSSTTNDKKLGLSTEVSILSMFFVGALVVIAPLWISISTTGAVAVILQSKVELHEFATRFTAKELKSIMQFVLLAAIIFPIVPDGVIDPLNVINPHDVWLMIILIVGLGLSGYVAYKFFGKSAGTLLSGILGGVISSTATTVNHAKLTRDNIFPSHHSIAIILIAWTVVYIRLGLEIFFVSPAFFWSSFHALSLLFVLSSVMSLSVWMKVRKDKTEMVHQENPSEIKVAFFFGLIYCVIVFSVAFAKETWASEALYLIAFLSGITDLDAITLSTANLVKTSKLSLLEGKYLLLIAASSNTLFKGIIFSFIAGIRNSYPILISVILTIGACFMIYLIG